MGSCLQGSHPALHLLPWPTLWPLRLMPSGLVRERKGRAERLAEHSYLIGAIIWRYLGVTLLLCFLWVLQRVLLLGFPTAILSGQVSNLQTTTSPSAPVFPVSTIYRCSILGIQYPSILSSWIRMKMTLGRLLVPCGPHLVSEKHSATFALTNFGNTGPFKCGAVNIAAQSVRASASHGLSCPIVFSKKVFLSYTK